MSADRPFRFTHRWAVPADARSVLALLADPAGYPRWWPAVPRVRRLGPGRAAVRLRGFVPVRLTMERLIDDRARGLLVALSLIHISEPTRREWLSRMPSSA